MNRLRIPGVRTIGWCVKYGDEQGLLTNEKDYTIFFFANGKPLTNYGSVFICKWLK